MKRRVEKTVYKLLGAKKSVTKDAFKGIIESKWGISVKSSALAL